MATQTKDNEIKYLQNMIGKDIFYLFFANNEGYKEVRKDSTFLEVKEEIVSVLNK